MAPSPLYYFTASCIAEVFALTLYYPYDMIKVRLQTSNDKFHYNSLSDAFSKIIKKSSLTGLYRGSSIYIFTYMINYSMQMMIYEVAIEKAKKKNIIKFHQYEWEIIAFSSCLSGIVSAAVTNPLECLAVRKQTDPATSLLQTIKQEKFLLMKKGLGARMAFNSLQSMFFFMTVNALGKIFNVNLHDD